mgnify:CR=1 FL=1
MKNHAYELGDLVKRDSAMGVVTKIEGMFLTLSLVDSGFSSEHVTANISRRDYLGIVKTETGVIYRNLTLDNRLLEHRANGTLEAYLSEDTKNKIVNQGEKR